MTESIAGAQVEAKIKELLGKITAAGKPAGILWAGDIEKCKSTALAIMIVPSTTTATCGRLMNVTPRVYL
jgi:2-keto-3-deoxy-L-rhamnonate aldolase RhmA